MSGAAGRRARAPYETVPPQTIGRLRLLTVNGVGIDLDGHRVFADGAEITLSPKEFDLLQVLFQNAGRALSRRQLLDAVWSAGYEDSHSTLNVDIRRLRGKLDPWPAVPRIRTVRGIGYVFDVDAAELTRR